MVHRCALHCIVPPGLLLRVAGSGSAKDREAALRTLGLDHTFRQVRVEHATRQAIAPTPPRLLSGPVGQPHRTIYDQQESDATELGKLARSEGQRAVKDPAVNEAFDGFGDTYKLFWEVFKRNSIDDGGMPILGLVHYSHQYANAFWDGEGHMFFGDGDGQLFTRLTKSVDVIGHELTHGVTQYTANLAYRDQSGALNESLSDVFGSLVAQYAKGETAEQASWLIGADVVGAALKPALRSLKAPARPTSTTSSPPPWISSCARGRTTAVSTRTRGSPITPSTSRPSRSGATPGRHRGSSGTTPCVIRRSAPTATSWRSPRPRFAPPASALALRARRSPPCAPAGKPSKSRSEPRRFPAWRAKTWSSVSGARAGLRVCPWWRH